MSDNGFVIVLVIMLLIFLVICGPLITIWALNLLFPVLAIPSTFATWFAVLWLGGAGGAILRGGSSAASK